MSGIIASLDWSISAIRRGCPIPIVTVSMKVDMTGCTGRFRDYKDFDIGNSATKLTCKSAESLLETVSCGDLLLHSHVRTQGVPIPSESLCARAHFESEHPDSAFPARWSSRRVARTCARVSGLPDKLILVPTCPVSALIRR